MKLSDIITDFEIYTTNEEQALLQKLPENFTPVNTFSERERFVIDNLVKKSLVSKFITNNNFFIKKNVQ